jgi:ferric-dicitrate binding protein FerR (iron transport regulator)
MSDNYRGPEDILSDESFLSWYFKTGDSRGKAWEQWMSTHPDRNDIVRQAITILETTRLPENEIPAPQMRTAEARLFQKIDALENAPFEDSDLLIRKTPGINRNRYRWMAAAAIFLAGVAGWLLTGPLRPARTEIKTQYGQIDKQKLPDGTEVDMNANSSLRYSPGWKDGADREVWVNGEVFFHVCKTPLKSRFIVHTEHFDIIVTGTHFNVVNRHGKDNVLLQEGSVTLRSMDGRTLHMAPGDFVAYDTFLVQKRPFKTDSVLAWKEQKLVLDRTPLRDLVTIINDHYGIPVRLAADSLGSHTISAVLPNNNLQILLQALEATGEFDIDHSSPGDSIIIRAHSEKN